MRYRVVRRKKKRIKVRRRRTERSFIPVYMQWRKDIEELSYNQYVPGWNREDVEAMMGYCLWVAHKKYQPSKGDFGKFFWSIWLNQRRFQIRTHNAMKRQGDEIACDYETLIGLSPIEFPNYLIDVYNPEVPESKQAMAWAMLALGYTRPEIMERLGIHWRKWYAMLESWRNEGVRYWLKEFDDEP